MQSYQTMQDERLKMVDEIKALAPRRAVLIEAIKSNQHFYTRSLKRLPRTDVLNELSTEEIKLLNRALTRDRKIGKMMWELYEIQKKMRLYCDISEKLVCFREQHFFMHKRRKDACRRLEIAIAAERGSIRNRGRDLLETHSRSTALTEREA